MTDSISKWAIKHHQRRRKLAWLVGFFLPVLLLPFSLMVELRWPFIETPVTFAGLLLVVIALAAAVCDLLWRRIPNWITLPGLVYALLLNAWPTLADHFGMADLFGMTGTVRTGDAVGAIGMSQSLLGAIACFVVMFVMYCVTQGGAGDVKLATVFGALLGLRAALLLLCCAYLLAVASAVAWVLWRRGLWATLGWLIVEFGLDRRLNRFSRFKNPSLPIPKMSLPLGFFMALSLPLTLQELV